MFRIDDVTASSSMPAPDAAGTEGYFTGGDPANGTPATRVRYWWLNMIQEELCSILAAAGIVRSKTSVRQVNSALQKMYAPVIGSARNASMLVSAASATATFTADQIVVGAALNGQTYVLPSFSKSINLGSVGAGGMDTGSAPTSGYVALYAICNPVTGATALLATDATSSVAPSVYGGANMPSGYTASALVSVWPTNASKQFGIGLQKDRSIAFPPVSVLNTSTQAASPTALSIAGAVPPNATSVTGNMLVQSSATTQIVGTIAASVSGIDGATFSNAASNVFIYNPFTVLINAQQTIFRTATIGSGTLLNQATVVKYTF
ncbi:hypothetical protein QCE62_06835 [Caballeronia sp. LZ033]|uniref:hypothetical protein n=1 Tax=Caballeronia sp. LZ033 TaxID=3038566 RepID=UPI00285498E7|nr:hypothetical protein [Caballeronia sp. LZ033]MDR5813306.1 hypothetical protein [Caballeronia sp. LZ033]